MVASVQYRALADKAADAFYKLSNTKGQIQSYVFDVIRASVPKLNLDAVFEQKNSIVKAVEEELEKATSAYGYEIVQTLIVDIEPDVKVKKAMTEINAGTWWQRGQNAALLFINPRLASSSLTATLPWSSYHINTSILRGTRLAHMFFHMQISVYLSLVSY